MDLDNLRQSVKINGTKISYLDNNVQSEISLVFIHGNSMSAQMFKHQFEDSRLQAYRCIALDLPGHGKSENLKQYSFIQNKTSIKNFAEKLKLKDYVIVAHSLGGHFAIQILPKLTGCIAVVLIGTPPLKSPLNMDEAFLSHPVIPLLFKNDLKDRELEVFANAVVSGESATLAKKEIKQTDPNFREHIMRSVQNGHLVNEVEILEQTKIAIALFVGQQDAFVNHNYLKDLNLPTLWNKRINSIKDASHTPQLENPIEFNKQLYEFIESLN